MLGSEASDHKIWASFEFAMPRRLLLAVFHLLDTAAPSVYVILEVFRVSGIDPRTQTGQND